MKRVPQNHCQIQISFRRAILNRWETENIHRTLNRIKWRIKEKFIALFIKFCNRAQVNVHGCIVLVEKHNLLVQMESSPRSNRRWNGSRVSIIFAIYCSFHFPEETHCLELCSVSSLMWWIHVSSTVTKLRQNSFRLRLNIAKPTFEVDTRWQLWTFVSKWGTQLADINL